eukprot:2391078-Amphidinium_carterae.1
MWQPCEQTELVSKVPACMTFSAFRSGKHEHYKHAFSYTCGDFTCHDILAAHESSDVYVVSHCKYHSDGVLVSNGSLEVLEHYMQRVETRARARPRGKPNEPKPKKMKHMVAETEPAWLQ